MARTAATMTPVTWAVKEGKNGIRLHIERAMPADIPEFVDLILSAFLNRNVVVAHMQIQEADYREYLTTSLEAKFKHGLSLLAKDAATGKLAGLLVIEQVDVTTYSKPPLWLRPLDSLGRKLWTDACNNDKISITSLAAGRVMRVDHGATAAEYEGLGVGMCLRSHVEVHARAHGFDACVVEAMSALTRHIWTSKLGYEVAAEAIIADFVDGDGSRPLESIRKSETMALCHKVLDPAKRRHSRLLFPVALVSVICKVRPWFFFKHPTLAEMAPSADTSGS